MPDFDRDDPREYEEKRPADRYRRRGEKSTISAGEREAKRIQNLLMTPGLPKCEAEYLARMLRGAREKSIESLHKYSNCSY